jgi:hypothetical protein
MLDMFIPKEEGANYFLGLFGDNYYNNFNNILYRLTSNRGCGTGYIHDDLFIGNGSNYYYNKSIYSSHNMKMINKNYTESTSYDFNMIPNNGNYSMEIIYKEPNPSIKLTELYFIPYVLNHFVKYEHDDIEDKYHEINASNILKENPKTDHIYYDFYDEIINRDDEVTNIGYTITSNELNGFDNDIRVSAPYLYSGLSDIYLPRNKVCKEAYGTILYPPDRDGPPQLLTGIAEVDLAYTKHIIVNKFDQKNLDRNKNIIEEYYGLITKSKLRSTIKIPFTQGSNLSPNHVMDSSLNV